MENVVTVGSVSDKNMNEITIKQKVEMLINDGDGKYQKDKVDI